MGQTTNRLYHAKDLKVTIQCIGQDKYDLLVIDTITNKMFLQRNGKQKDVIQHNWELFRDGGFKEML